MERCCVASSRKRAWTLEPSIRQPCQRVRGKTEALLSNQAHISGLHYCVSMLPLHPSCSDLQRRAMLQFTAGQDRCARASLTRGVNGCRLGPD